MEQLPAALWSRNPIAPLRRQLQTDRPGNSRAVCRRCNCVLTEASVKKMRRCGGVGCISEVRKGVAAARAKTRHNKDHARFGQLSIVPSFGFPAAPGCPVKPKLTTRPSVWHLSANLLVGPSSPHCSVSPPPRPATAPSRRCTFPAIPSTLQRSQEVVLDSFRIVFERFEGS